MEGKQATHSPSKRRSRSARACNANLAPGGLLGQRIPSLRNHDRGKREEGSDRE